MTKISIKTRSSLVSSHDKSKNLNLATFETLLTSEFEVLASKMLNYASKSPDSVSKTLNLLVKKYFLQKIIKNLVSVS